MLIATDYFCLSLTHFIICCTFCTRTGGAAGATEQKCAKKGCLISASLVPLAGGGDQDSGNQNCVLQNTFVVWVWALGVNSMAVANECGTFADYSAVNGTDAVAESGPLCSTTVVL